MKKSQLTVSRRNVLGLGLGLGSVALAACSSESSESSDSSDETQDTEDTEAEDEPEEESEVVEIDAEAFDLLVESGPYADDDVIASSEWASAIKEAGVMRVGCTQTSVLFSLLNEVDGRLRGFDAGLAQLLANYILQDYTAIETTNVTSDTRESVLQNDQVDAVFATYSITDARKELISFAGPYYTTQQSILVTADNTDINSVDDLAGKIVAAQSGSTGPGVLEEYAPEATIQEFSTDEEARTALLQGRVDAYVIDNNLNLGSMVNNPGKFRIAGDQFGPLDSYGIGLPKDSDAVEFVNDFLQMLINEGYWAELWLIAIGDRAGVDEVPDPPEIGA